MSKNKLTRRDFLKMAGVTSATLALSACGVDVTKLPDPTVTPSLTPFPTITNIPTLSPTPTLPTLGELGRKLGLDVGISLRIIDRFDNPDYQKFLLNFSMLTDAWAANPVWWTDENKERAFKYWNTLSSFAKSNNMSLDLNQLFWAGYFGKSYSPVNNLLTGSKDDLDTWMKARVKTFFEIPYFTSVNFATEVFYNNPVTLKYMWNTGNNPFYRIYNENWPYEAYKAVWNESILSGKKIGQDIRLVWDSASIEVSSPGAEYEYEYLKKLRNRLADEFGINKPFDVGMEMHIHTVPVKSGECFGWTSESYEKKKLREQFQKFGEIGDIRITSLSIHDTEDIQEQKDILHSVVEAFIESGVGRSLIMWGTQEQFDTDLSRVNLSCSMRNLLDSSYKPMFMFDELYKILQSKS